MSGHSKWATIKRKKGALDAKRGKLFTKIGRELVVAVKEGGPDPDSNSKLRDAIAKAKANNMPNDTIQRSIKKAAGEDSAKEYFELVYEGYGPSGVAFMVETLSDNKNRTAGDVRATFSKFGGALGSTGCVSYMFTKKGVIIVDGASTTEDELFELAIEAGADDVVAADDVFEVYTSPNDMGTVNEYLSAKVSVLSANIDMIPDNTVIPSPEQAVTLTRLIDRLEENDDVQNVYHNVDLPYDDEE
jgi:YebC/PmpR family DNA-binding regulatory protein